jgi:hypothetical protein
LRASKSNRPLSHTRSGRCFIAVSDHPPPSSGGCCLTKRGFLMRHTLHTAPGHARFEAARVVVRGCVRAFSSVARRSLGAVSGPLLGLLIASVGVLAGSANAWAEGSRVTFPLGAQGARINMALGGTNLFGGVVRDRLWVYVYAQQNEYILVGSVNRRDNGNIFIYNPQSFGVKGNETIPGTANFTCSTNNTGPAAYGGGTRGTITTRANELAGPNSADNTVTVTNGWSPCAYRAPSTGIYGVRFTGTNGGNNTDNLVLQAANVAANTNLLRLQAYMSAWEVQVRATNTSVTDINGRVFTYAWMGSTGSNAVPGAQVYNTLYYVTDDGYRFRQTQNGLNPFIYSTFANPQGFIDAGNALYKNIRGADVYVTNSQPPAAALTTQLPQYPIFISTVDDAGPNDVEVERVLTALGIPAVPPVPQLNSVTFTGTVSGSTTTFGNGGTFSFTTVNTLSYQIIISRDGVDFDPANVSNKVISGTAYTGTHNVVWDGRDNSGVFFPTGNGYSYRVEGRNGETHLPLLDTEGMAGGGPTIARLNGSATNRTIVYYDDRGYVTRNGTAVGQLNGHLCGAGNAQIEPSPNVSLVGIDSTSTYRSYNGPNNDPNTDCNNSATTYFGTAKGLDTWVLERTPVSSSTLDIIPAGGGADVGTQVSVTNSVLPGDTVVGTLLFFNNSTSASAATVYTTRIGTPGNCPAAVAFPVLPAGVTVNSYNTSTCVVTFNGMPAVLAATGNPGSQLQFQFTYVAPATGPQTIQTTISATGDTLPGAGAPNTATGSTAILTNPILSLAKSGVVGPINVATATSTTYDLTVFNQGAVATSGSIVINDTLRDGLLLTSFTGTNWACTGVGGFNVQCTYTGPNLAANGGSTVLHLTVSIAQFTVDANNTARVSGGGDPTCPAPPASAAARCTSTVDIGTVPVTLSHVKSAVVGNRINVEFTTLAEVGTAGFRVLGGRLGDATGRRLGGVVASKGSSLAPQDYSFQADYSGETAIWIEEVLTTADKSTLYGPYALGLEVGERNVADLINWPAIQSELNNYQAAHIAAIRSRGAGSSLEAEISVSTSGLAEVSYADLLAQGVDWAGLDPAKIVLTQGARSIPVKYSGPAQIGSGSSFSFLAEEIRDSLYTRTAVYRLRAGTQAAEQMHTVHANPAGLQPALVVRDWYKQAPNREYDLSARNADPYSAFRLSRFNYDTVAWTESFTLPNMAPNTDLDRVAVDLWSDFDYPHSLRFLVNGTLLGAMRFSGRESRTFETTVAPGVLRNGVNNLRVEMVGDTGKDMDSVNVEAIRVNYTRQLVADNNSLSFELSAEDETLPSNDSIFGDNFSDEGLLGCDPVEACGAFKVSGLTTPNVVVLRQRSNLVEQLTATRLTGSPGSYALEFASSRVTGDRFWIEPTSGRVAASIAPALAVRDPLDGPDGQLLIISHGSLINGLGAFVAARQAEGLSVRVVDVSDIYRFYGNGEVDPVSIDLAIRFASERIGTRYVLLVGGDTRDYLNYSGSNSISLIPTHYREVGTLVTFGPTDVPFADVDSDGKMDVAIGRWPVRTAAELDNVIQKTLAYAQADHGGKTLLLSDRTQQGVDFGNQLTLVPLTLGAPWTQSELRLEGYPVGATASARADMVAAVNSGQALTVYMGHGAPLAWTQEGLITSQLLTSGLFNNPTRPTITWALGCYGTYFTQPQYNSVSHGLLTRNTSGAAAVFGASTLTDIPDDMAWLNVLGPVLNGQRLGDSLRQAQNRLYDEGYEYRDVWLGVSLMGDPTLRLREGL